MGAPNQVEAVVAGMARRDPDFTDPGSNGACGPPRGEPRAHRSGDPVCGLAGAAAEADRVDEPVDEVGLAAQSRRHPGLAQALGVVLALVAQRVEAGGDDVRRRRRR